MKIDIRKLLKRKKKIVCKNGKKFVVQCKYGNLGDFCFVCGMVSHTERFCRKFLDSRGDEIIKERGNWLRAPQGDWPDKVRASGCVTTVIAIGKIDLKRIIECLNLRKQLLEEIQWIFLMSEILGTTCF